MGRDLASWGMRLGRYRMTGVGPRMGSVVEASFWRLKWISLLPDLCTLPNIGVYRMYIHKVGRYQYVGTVRTGWVLRYKTSGYVYRAAAVNHGWLSRSLLHVGLGWT